MPSRVLLHSIRAGAVREQLEVALAWSQAEEAPLGPGLATLVPLAHGGRSLLLSYPKGGKALAAFQFKPGASPALTPVEGRLEVGPGWEIIEPFTIGNRPHLLCYEPQGGAMDLFEVLPDLSVSRPYRYARAREPGITTGFTMVKPLVFAGSVQVMGYNQADGHVAIYTLAVTATSSEGAPPLFLQDAWSHFWAQGWTRFAFFQLGGENFFLKTNVWRPNVNIDHILDEPAKGTIEVATRMHLEDDQKLSIVEPFTLGHGEPHFVAYRPDGKAVLYHIFGDCQGWEAQATLALPPNLSRIVPLQSGEQAYLLSYLA